MQSNVPFLPGKRLMSIHKDGADGALLRTIAAGNQIWPGPPATPFLHWPSKPYRATKGR